MNNQSVPSSLSAEDVLGETMETYLSLEDAEIIHDAFKGNKKLIRAIQKIFIPTIQDPEMCPESMGEDFWMSGKQWDNMPVEEVKALVVARQDTIKHVMGGLIRIKAIANVKRENMQEIQNRRKKDSTK